MKILSVHSVPNATPVGDSDLPKDDYLGSGRYYVSGFCTAQIHSPLLLKHELLR
jgi:hypothetical protein